MAARSSVRWWERVLILGVAIAPVVILTGGKPRFSWKTGVAICLAAAAAALFTVWLDTRRRTRALKDRLRSVQAKW